MTCGRTSTDCITARHGGKSETRSLKGGGKLGNMSKLQRRRKLGEAQIARLPVLEVSQASDFRRLREVAAKGHKVTERLEVQRENHGAPSE